MVGGGSCSNQTRKIRLVSDLEGAEGHAKDFGFYPLSGKKKSHCKVFK